MDSTTRTRQRHRVAWLTALLSLTFVPVALADHDRDDYDDDDYGYYHDGRRGNDGRFYDRYGYWPEQSCDSPARYGRFESLRGQGRWRFVPGAGTTLWFPYVSTSWRPYLYGHWVHSNLGMTWVSYDPWGDIPHHYGRWVFVDHYGWGWVPGYEYAPAWVTWGVSDGYIGWAPLPPAGYRASFGYHSSGLDFSLWVFVSNRDFYGTSVSTHAVPVGHTLSLFKEKKVRPVGRDLSFDYVQRVSPQKVRSVQIDRRNKTVGGRTVVFREPRGQSEKVRSGRELTRSTVTRADTRRTGREPAPGRSGKTVKPRETKEIKKRKR